MPPDAASRDAALVMDIVLAARDALDFVVNLDEAAFLASRLHQNAVIRSIEVIGEAAGQLSREFREANDQVSWREMTGMRHRLIHGYADVRLDVVWDVVANRLPTLLATLDTIEPL